MEELEDREETSESVNVPMLIFFCDTPTKIEVIQEGCRDRQYKVRIWFIQIWKPQHAGTSKIFILMGYLPYTHDHYDEHWELDYVANVKLEQARFGLFLIVEHCRTEMVRSLIDGQL